MTLINRGERLRLLIAVNDDNMYIFHACLSPF